MRSSLGAETGAARSRFAKRHGDWIGGGMGRRERDADLKGRGQNRNIKGWWRLCRKALSAALRGLKAQQVRSPGQRPGYHAPFPTPCKGKSKNQPFAHTFALTGRRRLYTDTQGVALGCKLAALSGRSFSRFVRFACRLRHRPPKKRRRQRFRPLSPAQFIFYECLWPYVLDAFTLQLMLPLL